PPQPIPILFPYHDALPIYFVEARINGEIAEVHHLDLAPVTQSLRCDCLLGENRLRGAQSDASRFHTVVLRGVHRQSAPAATNIEQTIAWLEPQLAANVIELVSLGGHEVVRLLSIVCTGVAHTRVEPERVEIVPEIVMKADFRLGAFARTRSEES